jgi:ribosomal protein S18 acetylase RimI-like enzyme
MDPLIRPATGGDRQSLEALLAAALGSHIQAAHGELMDCAAHEALLALVDGAPVGAATFRAGQGAGECELTALAARDRQRGVGSALVRAVAAEARARGWRRIVLTTTNDNLDAMRFYMRRGFRLESVRPGAVDQARRDLKPEIPRVGESGIAMRDEVVFVLELDGEGG